MADKLQMPYIIKIAVFLTAKGKEAACNAGDLGSIVGLEKSTGERIGYTLQYSYLENSMDRGPWQVIVHGVKKSQTQLSN